MTPKGSVSTTPGKPSGQFQIHGDTDTMVGEKADNGVDAVPNHRPPHSHLGRYQKLTRKQGATDEASHKHENVVPLTTSKFVNTSASNFYSGSTKVICNAVVEPVTIKPG